MLIERTIVTSQGTGPTYMSVEQAAVELALSSSTIRRYIAAGILESEKFGRTVRIRVESVYRRKGEATA
jgi:excisionase family DNA binding protein